MRGKPVIILVRPQMAENIGMAARAMANFGLADLRLVAPREGWPQADGIALQAASGARHILEQAVVFPSVSAAIGDLTRVYATTARERGQAKPVMTPDVAMAELAAQPGGEGRIGILFGPERTGLENDDVSLADAVITFPIDPAFSSLNLAQAVLLVAYEWMKASGKAVAPFDLPHQTGPARRETLIAFFDFVETALDQLNFYSNADRKPVVVRNFRNILHRMALTEQDVRTLRSVFDTMIRGGRGRHGIRRSQTGEDG